MNFRQEKQTLKTQYIVYLTPQHNSLPIRRVSGRLISDAANFTTKL